MITARHSLKFLIPSLILFSIFLMFLVPMISLAQSNSPAPIVPCNNNSAPVTNSDGTITTPVPCDFDNFLALISNVIRFFLFDMAVPIAAIMFAYAGFMLVSSGGSIEKRGTAKKIFTNVALGLIIAIAAWLIIHTILVTMGFKGDWIGF